MKAGGGGKAGGGWLRCGRSKEGVARDEGGDPGAGIFM